MTTNQLFRLVSRTNPQAKTIRSIRDLVAFMFERDLTDYILVVSDEKGDRVVTLPSTDEPAIYKALGTTQPVVEDVKPVEVKPVEVKPVEVKPVEVKPVEVKPVKPVEVKLVVPTPVANTTGPDKT